MNQILDQMEARMNEIERESNSKIQALQKKLTESREDVARAEAAIEAAAEGEDVKAYQKAKADRADALAAVELFEGRLAALMKEPLITEDDYQQTVKEIMEAIAAEDAEAFAKLEKLAKQMDQIGAALQDTITKGNRLLDRWQHKIFREPKDVYHRDKKYDNFKTTWWASLAAQRKPQQ